MAGFCGQIHNISLPETLSVGQRTNSHLDNECLSTIVSTFMIENITFRYTEIPMCFQKPVLSGRYLYLTPHTIAKTDDDAHCSMSLCHFSSCESFKNANVVHVLQEITSR